MLKEIIVARHQGFCMGVKRAIKIAEETGRNRETGERVTILNEIVHNEAVVERFRSEGVRPSLSVDDVPDGTLIISAHGVGPDVIEKAKAKGLKVVDATCPLVSRIYRIIERIIAGGGHIVHFGDPDHDETAGILGHAPARISLIANREELLALPDWPDRKLGLTVQTTAHVAVFDEIRTLALKKWPHIEVFETVCKATTHRQTAVLELTPAVDLVLVVGSRTSANSNRLVNISRDAGSRGYLIGSQEDIKVEWFKEDKNVDKVGVSAGASTPQFLIEEVIDRLVAISGGTAGVTRLEQPEDQEHPDTTDKPGETGRNHENEAD